MRLSDEKAALRTRLRATRAAITPEERAAAVLEVTQRVVRATAGRGTIMGFLAFGSELPTLPLLERLGAEGHVLAVPHIAEGDLTPVAFRPGEALVEAVWGIPEPANLRVIDPLTIEVVVAPGLGFDRSGFRVGYGGGFYDRLLPRLRPDVLRVGIGFHAQVIPGVPHGPEDQRLDLVITERETINCS